MPGRSAAPAFVSASDFDITGILARVASKPSIGLYRRRGFFLLLHGYQRLQPDFPPVYVSPTLLSECNPHEGPYRRPNLPSKMTGYDVSEFIGRNCCFLRPPHGESPKLGIEVANDPALKEIRQALAVNEGFQTALKNYCKNGQTFINLITVIQISWGGDITRYWFQVDIGQTMSKDVYQRCREPLNEEARRSVSDRLKRIAVSHAASDRPREVLNTLLVD